MEFNDIYLIQKYDGGHLYLIQKYDGGHSYLFNPEIWWRSLIFI